LCQLISALLPGERDGGLVKLLDFLSIAQPACAVYPSKFAFAPIVSAGKV
jgi:hypothetical protein